jgi:hypothetical protein
MLPLCTELPTRPSSLLSVPDLDLLPMRILSFESYQGHFLQPPAPQNARTPSKDAKIPVSVLCMIFVKPRVVRGCTSSSLPEMQKSGAVLLHIIAIKKVGGGLRMAPLTRRDETLFPSHVRKALSPGQRSALVCPTCCRACMPVEHASEGQGR